MNKLILSGYPYTNITKFEQLLKHFGMKSVLPSRREKLLPSDINNILKDEYNLNFERKCYKGNDVEINPLWHTLILDLMLGNVEQDIYGWIDSNAIFLFDYWKALDSVGFVFVFEAPGLTIKKNVEELLDKGEKVDLSNIIDEWKIYHKSLIEQCKKHPDICVLFSLDNSKESILEYYDVLNAKINNSFKEFDFVMLEESLRDEDSLRKNDNFLQNLIDQAIMEDRTCVQIFQELIRISNNKKKLIIKREKTPFTRFLIDYLDKQSQIYNDFFSLRQRITCLEEINSSLMKEQVANKVQIQSFVKQLFNTQEQLESNILLISNKGELKHKLDDELNQIKLDFNKNKENLNHLKSIYDEKLKEYQKQNVLIQEKDEIILNQRNKIDDILNKNNILLKKLIQTQELLEKKYKQIQDRGVDNVVKQQLPYQLGALILENARDFKSIVQLPSLILKEKQKHVNEEEPIPNTLKEKKQLDKVKNHLSYRLGRVIVDNTKASKDYYKVPLLMTKEIVKFKFHKKH